MESNIISGFIGADNGGYLNLDYQEAFKNIYD